MFNIAEIKKFVRDSGKFTRGVKYFENNKVESLKFDLDQMPEILVMESEVEGSGYENYNTSFLLRQIQEKWALVSESAEPEEIEPGEIPYIDLNNYEIDDYYCTCLSFDKDGMPCKHIAALMLLAYYRLEREYRKMNEFTEMMELLERQKKEIDKNNLSNYINIAPKKEAKIVPHVVTDYLAKNLIKSFQTKFAQSIRNNEVKVGYVKLTEKIEVHDENLVTLSLNIADNKPYVVKSIEDFVENMKNGTEVNYGKQLVVTHIKEAFVEDSKELLEFVIKKGSELSNFNSLVAFDHYSYRYTNKNRGYYNGRRSIILSDDSIDEIFQMNLNKKLLINFKNGNSPKGRENQYQVVDRKIIYEIKVSKSANNGYIITAPIYNFIEGKEHIYIEDKDQLLMIRLSQDVSKKLVAFMTALSGSGRKFIIAENDMPEFYVNVLQELESFSKIKNETGEELDFKPEEFDANIYLDYPVKNIVTAIVICKYGEIQFDPYLEIVVDLQIEKVSGKSETVNIERVNYVDKEINEISRDSRKELILKMDVKKYFKLYSSHDKVLVINGDPENDGNIEELFEFVNTGAFELSKKYQVFVSDRYKKIANSATPKLEVGVRIENDLLEINFNIENLPLDELFEILKSYKKKNRFHRLRDGKFIKLGEESLEEILQFVEDFHLTQADIRTGKTIAPKYRAMYLNSLLKNSERVNFERDGHFKNLIRGMKTIEDSEYEEPEDLKHILRDYQKMGFRWLKTLDSYGFCGILADDMGLGKTIQVISLLLAKKEDAKNHLPSIVICPTSLVLNWEIEILKFAPQLVSAVIIGNASERGSKILESENCDLYITSYDLLKRDIASYQSLQFEFIIIDEAQFIKNQNTLSAKSVKALKGQRRFALTGTPIENRLSELWSIFDFLMPGYLNSYKKFKDEYETDIVKSNDQYKVEILNKQVRPFILRRLKKNVLKELPDKIESVAYAKMGEEQEKLYLANLALVKTQLGQELSENGFEKSKIIILAMLTKLRQICCHPKLCFDNYKGESAKLDTCMEIISEAVSGGHKILVFSQFTSMLEIIKAKLEYEQIKFFMLTGKTDKAQRAKMVESFNQDDTEVFLISLKAGGTGLNLTGADIVIHFDPWWNLAAQNQATDRTHRIGQKNSVQVYQLIAKDTLEEKIIQLQQQKQDLADAIISENAEGFHSLSLNQLMEIL